MWIILGRETYEYVEAIAPFGSPDTCLLRKSEWRFHSWIFADRQYSAGGHGWLWQWWVEWLNSNFFCVVRTLSHWKNLFYNKSRIRSIVVKLVFAEIFSLHTASSSGQWDPHLLYGYLPWLQLLLIFLAADSWWESASHHLLWHMQTLFLCPPDCPSGYGCLLHKSRSTIMVWSRLRVCKM